MTLVPFRRQQRSPAAFGTGFEDFDRLFDGLFRNALTNLAAPGPALTDLAVRMDVSETDKAYIVHAELPGIEEKDIDVTLTDGILTISGEKKSESEDKSRTWHRVERSYGSFRRALSLPADADENGVTARMKHGILEIEIAKTREAEKPVRKISIQSK